MADDDGTAAEDPTLGAWARVGDFVGVVARVADGRVSLFDPGERQVTEAGRDEVQVLPAGAVTVTVRVDLPLAHGFDEERLRGWLMALVDQGLQGRAVRALTEAGLDEGALLPPTRLSVAPAETSGALCLCGTRTPAPPQAAVACAACGRQAVSPPVTGTGGQAG
jgi:hypothetical protein